MVSKTKLAAILIGGSAILGTVAAFLNGNIVFFDALQAVLYEVGGICAVFGIYGWGIFDNNNK